MSVSDEHFLDWFRASPCLFARVFAARKRIRPVELLEAFTAKDVADLDVALDAATLRDEVVLIFWPLLRTDEDVIAVLRTLHGTPRWKCSRVPWGNHPREGAALVGLTWTTSVNNRSSVMGFAPLGSMPVTRRAPYVAVAVWPGRHENTEHRSAPGHVGFIDCKPDLPPEHTYDHLWKQTLRATKALLESPPADDRWVLHDVAFCLPTKAVESFLPAT